MNNKEIDLTRLVPSVYERVVAVETDAHGTAVLYQRLADGRVESVEVPFQPWLLVNSDELTEDLAGIIETVPLKGPGEFRLRVHFADEAAYKNAVTALKKRTGLAPGSPPAPYRLFADSANQLLSLLPARLFRGMAFSELRRMQVDIETVTTPGFDFCNASREGDAIVMVAMRDSSGWEKCLRGPELSEPEILRQMVALVRERDPDVIEGHNIFNFDLPYIRERCRRYKISLALGRDSSVIRPRPSRMTLAERTVNYERFDIFGRHVVDTMHLVQLYDISHRDMDSYGLKYAARYFGVAAAERTYVEGSEISSTYKNNPELLADYAMDDVRETDAVSAILSPSYFYQAQIVPFSYQNCVVRGNATRIDALLTATYMQMDAALPRPESAQAFQGALTASFETGIFHNIWHIDVQSLYPSIIVGSKQGPYRDHLGVFMTMLSLLRQFRLQAKRAAREALDKQERDHYEALQSSFKILINSFYGYLGFGQGTFNDFAMAEATTATGRQILTRMMEFLRDNGGRIIEMDTDGIYFVPPPESGELLEKLQKTLPDGIEVELDAVYDAMFGYKSKNYALLSADGKVSVTGAALKSRGLEPFQRRFMQELITLLLQEKTAAAAALFASYRLALAEHKLPLRDLAKRETLSMSPRNYQQKLAAGTGKRSAAYELVLNSEREYKQGDQVSFYITGNNKRVAVVDSAKLLADAEADSRDENVPYYLDKLEKLRDKFAEFIPDNRQGTLF